MHKAALLAILFIGVCGAAVVGPRIYEQDDFGDIIFKEFAYSISADCVASRIDLYVYNESLKPVPGVNTYLKYIDFSSPLLSSAVTDKDGYSLHKLPGQVTLMRGLFILVIEKTGYRSKEVHFDLSPCWKNYTQPAQPPSKPPPEQNATPPQNGSGDPDAGPQNDSGTVDGNQSADDGAGGDEAPGALACPAALLLILPMFFKAVKA
ncbi:MAG: hypothetical protein V1827_05010 [Candidatus Micrarchaeota archaeon]